MKEPRNLRADEIEARVAHVTETGCSVLLYKTARVDAAMLDELVGAENWQCEFYTEKGSLFCRIGIWTGEQWVWKSDAGAPSNMEAQKGEASDAFKRAGFKWGIGRELYTAPFIWVPVEALDKHYKDQRTGKWACRDKFTVTNISIRDKRIAGLEISNARGVVYRWNNA